MALVRKTRDVFLWCMSVIYLFAFTSYYVQIPGLLGDNGVLPARVVKFKEVNSVTDFFQGEFTLLRLMPFLGLTCEKGMDLLCLLGILLSFLCMVMKSFRNSVEYSFLWLLYLSLYSVGQTFYYFQWDSLLLEAGFLTILVAPLNMYVFFWKTAQYHHHDNITLFLIKWLLFRLMFASGVVKLNSMCPSSGTATCWGLTALNYHFESQCIPTQLSWYAHHLPNWMLRLGVVATYIIEILLPFLFFSSIRHLRMLSFYAQVILQVLIILTGNYNFFNILTITLCISLVDDDFFKKKPIHTHEVKSVWNRLADWLITIAVYVFLIYVVVVYFSLSFGPGYTSLRTQIAFTKQEFSDLLGKVVPITIYIGAVALGVEVLISLVRCWKNEKGVLRKTLASGGVLVTAFVATIMFSISLVPYTSLDVGTNSKLPTQLKSLHSRLQSVELTSHYGLFRVMTGKGGRPEVIIEGSDDMKAWKEYHFLYKPGNTSRNPPLVTPHQPRLDWQMWFAALGDFHHNPWLLTLCYRLMTGQKEVLQLMDKNPFPEKPPTYLRATLYHYHYTSPYIMSKKYSKDGWWVREKVSSYLPIIDKNDQGLLQWLQQNKVFEPLESLSHTNWLMKCLIATRDLIGQPDGFLVNLSLFFTGVVLNVTKYFLF
ncbi:lipase maturation factor 2-like isoform X1 [Argonauta hians]